MNLFRSEEDAKSWALYDPISEESIMPLADWANVFSGPWFCIRMQPDSLAKRREDSVDFAKKLHKLGRSGSFWFAGH